MKSTVILIESDVARRAKLSRFLSRRWHVEPFEDVTELLAFWPSSAALIFAHDDGEMIEQLMNEPSALCLPVFAYSKRPPTERVVQAIRRGVTDYFSLPLDPKTALPKLEAMIELVKEEVAARRQHVTARRLVDDLSQRETDVGRELLAGHSNKGIAKVLGISPRTVEIHRANMMAKLQVNSTAEAVKVLIEARMLN